MVMWGRMTPSLEIAAGILIAVLILWMGRQAVEFARKGDWVPAALLGFLFLFFGLLIVWQGLGNAPPFWL